MGGKIAEVYSKGIANILGIKAGDEILSVNGKVLKDIFDFQFLIQESYLEIEVKHNDEIKIYEIEKLPEEGLGIQFESPVFDNIKRCQNSCIFCFIDQLPKGLRHSLYLKDDDYRLSFLYGNYITLTNIKEEELRRIIKYRLSPLYISVHSTNDDVRLKLVRNKKTLSIFEKLTYLIENGISINVQIVLIPDINDKEILKETIQDLAKLHKGILSIAIVPVGLTKYRHNLPSIRKFRKEEMLEVISMIYSYQKQFRKNIGRGFVYLADEFYLEAGVSLPSIDYYDTFSQIEDGIGMGRWFIEEMKRYIKQKTNICKKHKKIAIITGILGKKVLDEVIDNLKEIFPFIEFSLIEVKNNFFGKDITVTGLLTARDILNKIKNLNNEYDQIFIPDIVLNDEDRFLDDMDLEEFIRLVNKPVTIVDISPNIFLKEILC